MKPFHTRITSTHVTHAMSFAVALVVASAWSDARATEDHCAQREGACIEAARLAKESQSSPTLFRGANGILALPARANGPLLVTPFEVKWTHAQFDWLVRQGKAPGVSYEAMKDKFRSTMLAGCRQWPTDHGAGYFLSIGGFLVFEYVSLDGILIDKFAVQNCTEKGIKDVRFAASEQAALKTREELTSTWDWSRKTFLYAGGSSDCYVSESGSPAAPWGNKRKYKVVASANPVERWHVKTALFEDGSTETLYHFTSMAGCRIFKSRMDGVAPVPNRKAF